MPTLNVKLTTNGQPLDDPLLHARIRVGEDRYQQDTPEKAGHSLLIEPGGTVAMEYLPVGGYQVWPFADGFEPIGVVFPLPVALVEGDNPQIEIPMQPVGVENGQLGTSADPKNLLYGFTSQGKPWQLRGYTAHLLPVRVMQGRDIRPFLREAIGYGANTIITIGSHLSQWKKDNGFHFDPRTQQAKDALRTMFDIGAEMKIRFAHGVAADFQYGLSDTEKRRIWDEQCELMDGRWNLLARCGNESEVNGWHPDLFPQKNLHGVLQSAGSVGLGKPPHQGYRDWSEWEGRRLPDSPWHKCLDDAGAGMFEQLVGYADQHAIPVPTVMIEGQYFADTNPDHVGDKRETDPQKALMYGLQIGASGAGGGVGTSRGLEGDPNGPVAAECARQQFRAMKAAFLR